MIASRSQPVHAGQRPSAVESGTIDAPDCPICAANSGRKQSARFARASRILHQLLLAFALGAVLFAPAQNWHVAPSQDANLHAALIVSHGTELRVARTAASADPKYRALAADLSRRYRIALGPAEQLVGVAHDAGRAAGVDPLLILAVIGIESRFNPIAESAAGAKGLMQIVPRHHQDTLDEHGGDGAVLDPMTNMLVGARILKRYVYRAGSLEGGLQFYNGARPDKSRRYAQKVIAERQRLQSIADRFERAPVIF